MEKRPALGQVPMAARKAGRLLLAWLQQCSAAEMRVWLLLNHKIISKLLLNHKVVTLTKLGQQLTTMEW